MNDPLRSFKLQPWRSLSLVAGVTIAIAMIGEGLLIWGYTQSSVLHSFLNFLFSPPLGIILSLAAAVGVGVLGVYLCEQWQRQVILNSGSLWALVLCLAVGILLKSLLPLPPLLVGFSYETVIFLMVGVFWKGRPYWR
ncbi:MAG: peptide chain release factor 1 [Oscillatoria sp. PMC 1051.18]|nr:peptide chain release factor 1 [Oscillatoria sp. PMC 1050.18]MEC5028776.1 peptide chain release factor 1 [Oscillatoria sp. PMC 1051.18]